jgi:penicillin-binding protein 1A
VGGRDFNTLKVDLVRGADGGGSGRQPGSTFKPFVLEAALANGITLADRYPGPEKIDVDVEGAPWTVENYGGESFGSLTVAEATAHSVNTVYAQLMAAVGPDKVVQAAQAMGIDAELDAVPSIALGAEEVSPLDLASAYLTLADDGTRAEPYAIARIEDRDGNVIWEPDRPEPKADAIDPDIARAVTHALQGVIDGGTGAAADIGRPAAGKTGTTQDNVDAWFAGYVPGYAAVVWMGYPQPKPMDDVQGRSVTGGAFPAQIWSRFMAAAVEGRKADDFPPPPEELLERSRRQAPPAPSSTSTTTADTTTSTTEDESSTTTEATGGSSTTTPTSTPPSSGPPTTTATTTATTVAAAGTDPGTATDDPDG